MMAQAVGDHDAAITYARLEEQGAEALVDATWNGEYFEQRVVVPDEHVRRTIEGQDPAFYPGEVEPRYQYGAGCMTDQVVGQWLAHVAGLGHVLPQEKVRSALAAVVDHNWRADLSNHESCQRTFALNEEPGLLLCTWPRGGRPAYPFPYADEVWTGCEYQVAAHLIYEGFVEDGLRLVEGARARYDGRRRNPWNEFECGHHYARAMSSWSLLLALSGFRYAASDGRLGFAPAVSVNDFSCLYTTGSGWGVYRQVCAGMQRHSVDVVEGILRVRILDVPVLSAAGLPHARLIDSPEQPLRVEESADNNGVSIHFREEVTIDHDQPLVLTLEW